MTDYAVGDIQGCYRELMDVLSQVAFNPKKDTLWVVGDIVNRGPDSRAALKFLFDHRKAVNCVLGNHDLHLLSIYHGIKTPRRNDTVHDILKARQRHDWIDWLRSLPLCFYDATLNYCMVHAGIAPSWTLKQALKYSAEVEAVLQSEDITDFLQAMYGNEPALWKNDLKGYDRLRCITNHFTRMRLISKSGKLNLSYKGTEDHKPRGHQAWFEHPKRKAQQQRIIFGHWAALGGYVNHKNLFGLDTGCVWGRSLTMMNLSTQEFYIAQAQ